MRVATLAVLLGATACATSGQPVGKAAGNVVDAIARDVIEHGPVLGMAIVVRRDGSVVYEGAWGFADSARTEPVSPATVFDVASVTKPFTAALVLQLVAQGRLALDDALPDRLPGVSDAWRGVTVRHLLSQTSGIPDYMIEGDSVARERGAPIDAG